MKSLILVASLLAVGSVSSANTLLVSNKSSLVNHIMLKQKIVLDFNITYNGVVYNIHLYYNTETGTGHWSATDPNGNQAFGVIRPRNLARSIELTSTNNSTVFNTSLFDAIKIGINDQLINY